MEDNLITYEALYEILRAEKYKKELQKLDPNFFKNVINYLAEKQSILESQEKKTSIFASVEVQKTRRQIENLKRILQEIYEKRETKILQLALISSRIKGNKKEISSMLPEEELLYNSIHKTLNAYREGILNNILTVNLPKIEVLETKDLKNKEKTPDTKLIRFLHAIPKFVGKDMQVYGPFNEEDIASLPKEVASLLIEKKRAELIPTKK